MLTIFACPKPFTNPHVAIIQRNAITSWTLLQPRLEIILYGDEEGTADICKELGLRHVPSVARNEYGTPLLNDMFEQTQRLATNTHLCFINADIILMNDLVSAVGTVTSWNERHLIVGQRWDLDIEATLAFDTPDWAEQLRATVRDCGKQKPPSWIDYFVFVRGVFEAVPAFAIGRPFYDQWLIWHATKRGVPVIDATPSVLAVHQNHDYSHAPGGETGRSRRMEGPEGQRNIELAGGWTHCYTIADANYRLTSSGIERNLSGEHFRSRIELARRWLVDWTRPLRHRVGIRRKSV